MPSSLYTPLIMLDTYGRVRSTVNSDLTVHNVTLIAFRSNILRHFLNKIVYSSISIVPSSVYLQCRHVPPSVHYLIPPQPSSVHYPLYTYPHRDRIGTRPSSRWWTTWMPIMLLSTAPNSAYYACGKNLLCPTFSIS